MASELEKPGTEPRPSAVTRALRIESRSRVEFKDVTSLIQKTIEETGIKSGICHLFVPHTTAAVLINENDDPALMKDLDNFLARLAPAERDYLHNDGNCDAHLKAALIGGSSKSLLIENGRLILGRWQGVYFCEFDGPRRRDLRLKVVPD
jgi:secondary thiamine-phosphate synthase enzyme